MTPADLARLARIASLKEQAARAHLSEILARDRALLARMQVLRNGARHNGDLLAVPGLAAAEDRHTRFVAATCQRLAAERTRLAPALDHARKEAARAVGQAEAIAKLSERVRRETHRKAARRAEETG